MNITKKTYYIINYLILIFFAISTYLIMSNKGVISSNLNNSSYLIQMSNQGQLKTSEYENFYPNLPGEGEKFIKDVVNRSIFNKSYCYFPGKKRNTFRMTKSLGSGLLLKFSFTSDNTEKVEKCIYEIKNAIDRINNNIVKILSDKVTNQLNKELIGLDIMTITNGKNYQKLSELYIAKANLILLDVGSMTVYEMTNSQEMVIEETNEYLLPMILIIFMTTLFFLFTYIIYSRPSLLAKLF